jgi:thiamine pyrophosphate-dependent acetolactate synthase large subunit-like protein
MRRIELLQRLVARLSDEAVVAGIGNTNFDLLAAGARAQNFYMLGSMGLAFPIALGVALAQPARRTVGIEGDGSLLMNLGCLATIGMLAPPNLILLVLDNGGYQITGMQPAASATSTDLVEVARGAGIRRSDWARDEEHFERLLSAALSEPGPTLIGVRIDRSAAAGEPERDPPAIRDRFVRGMRA